MFITGLNEAAAAVTRVFVSLDDPLTTVEGFVQLVDGTPVENAEVSILGLSNQTTTDSAGHFSLANVPTNLGILSVRARALGDIGTASGIQPMPDGLTDAGIIKLTPPPSNEGQDFILVFQQKMQLLGTSYYPI